MQRIDLCCCDGKRIVVIPEYIAQREHEVRFVFGLVCQCDLVHVGDAFFVVQMLVCLDGKGKGRSGRALGVEAVLRRRGECGFV